MTNVEKVKDFLDKSKSYLFLTIEGEQPVGRPFGFHLMIDGKLYFACGKYDFSHKELTGNYKLIVAAVGNGEYLRYSGDVKVVKEEPLITKILETMPRIREYYDKSGMEIRIFYLENGHAEITNNNEIKEEFDV